MEDLIELVAASFARHGIECPASDPQLDRPVPTTSAQPKLAQADRPAEPPLPPRSQTIITEKARRPIQLRKEQALHQGIA